MSQFLVMRVGGGRCALPTERVGSVFRMAAVTSLPQSPAGLAGVLNIRGRVLPVVDPRPVLGWPTPEQHPSQYLVSILGDEPFLLWVDEIEGIESTARGDEAHSRSLNSAASAAVLPSGDGLIPVLAVEQFRPGGAESSLVPETV